MKCDHCLKVVDKLFRSRFKWLCGYCMSDLVREAEALVAQTVKLMELVNAENNLLKQQIKLNEETMELFLSTSEAQTIELEQYRQKEEEELLAQ